MGTNNRLPSDGTFNDQYDAHGKRTRKTEISTGNYATNAWDHQIAQRSGAQRACDDRH
jgi:hypothetical protein